MPGLRNSMQPSVSQIVTSWPIQRKRLNLP